MILSNLFYYKFTVFCLLSARTLIILSKILGRRLLECFIEETQQQYYSRVHMKFPDFFRKWDRMSIATYDIYTTSTTPIS